MLKYISAIIILLTLTAPVAAGTEKYVDVVFGSNAFDGGSWATPWATPSYAVDTSGWMTGTASAHDTIYVRANASDSHYIDAIIGAGNTNKFLDWVGVSDTGFTDSPTWAVGRSEGFYIQVTDDSAYYRVIDGLRFNGSSAYPIFLRVSGGVVADTLYVKNCIFDADTFPDINNGGGYGTCNVNPNSNMTADFTAGIHFLNSVWYRCKYPIFSNAPIAGNNRMLVTVENCAIRSCSTAIADGPSNGFPADTQYQFVNSIIDADTLYYCNDMTVNRTDVKTFAMTNCDTFSQEGWQNITGFAPLYNVVRTNVYDYFQDFTDTDGAIDAEWCYLNSTSIIRNLSTTGGPLGPSWSFIAATDGAVARRRNNYFMSTWREVLGLGW